MNRESPGFSPGECHEHFLPWLECHHAACVENPDAEVWVSR